MNTDKRVQFTNQLMELFIPVQHWAMKNWPDPSHPLTKDDFAPLWREIFALGRRHPPEPEQGGPQYINEYPAPWP